MAGSTPDADTPQVVTAHENTNIKGGSAATVQFNLEQFGSPSEASTAAGSTMRHIPVADIERVSLPVAQLQPADEGFGAWSYAASAFAMFITVWGKLNVVTITISVADAERRISGSFPCFPSPPFRT